MIASVYDQLVTKTASIAGLVSKIAAEGRAATPEEKSQLDALKSEVDSIKSGWESDGRRAFLAGIQKPEKNGLVLKAGDSFADQFKGQYPNELEGLNLGLLVRGVVTGEWGGAELERKATLSTNLSSAGGFLVPEPLANQVIDLARNQSYVVAAGAGTVAMTSSTLDIAKLLSDPTVSWYPENGTIAETDVTFGRASFKANKMACVVRISNELLEDAANVQTIVENAIASAIALELDRTAIVGTGAGQPLGVTVATGVNAISGVGTLADYDDFIDAVFACRGYNFNPNAAMYSPTTGKKLAKMVTGLASDLTKLVPPADFANLQKFVTNQIGDTVAVVGDWSQYMIGLRSQIRIDVSREADTSFMKNQVLIRATYRGDGMPLNPRAFAVLSGIS
jgi:HK97 family phage major capsid protein